MRKIWIFLTMIVALLLSSVAISAAPQDLVGYYPASTAMLLTIRADDAYIDELDAILRYGNDDAPPEFVLPPLRDLLQEEITTGVTVLDLLELVGDEVAIGIFDLENTDGQPLIVARVDDRAGVQTLFESEMPGSYSVSDGADGATIFTSESDDALFTLTDDLLTMTTLSAAEDYLAAGTLADDPTYRAAFEQLPGDGYNALVYVALAPFASADPSLMMASSVTPAVMLGFDILDGRTLEIDIATLSAEPLEAASLNLDFADEMPTDTNASIHATNLTAQLQQIDALSGGMLLPELEAGLQELGFNLQEDILAWTTGDYALYLRADVLELVAAGAPLIETGNGSIDLDGTWDAGILIEATDPDAARLLATRIGGLLPLFLADIEFVTVEQVTVGDVDVTQVTVMTPPSPPLEPHTFSISMGANESVFFIVTDTDALPSLSGAEGLTGNPAYNDALSYALSDPVGLWYADGEGQFLTIGGGTVGVLALLGPAIGGVFEDIITDLEGDLSVPQQKGLRAQSASALQAQLEWALSQIGSGTISSAVTEDGHSLTRFVISYAE